jgi:hypothetical protein
MVIISILCIDLCVLFPGLSQSFLPFFNSPNYPLNTQPDKPNSFLPSHHSFPPLKSQRSIKCFSRSVILIRQINSRLRRQTRNLSIRSGPANIRQPVTNPSHNNSRIQRILLSSSNQRTHSLECKFCGFSPCSSGLEIHRWSALAEIETVASNCAAGFGGSTDGGVEGIGGGLACFSGWGGDVRGVGRLEGG